MDNLKRLLLAENINVSDLDAEVKALGYTPDSLTDEQTNQVFDKLKAKYKNSKTTKKTTAMAKPDSTPNTGNTTPISAIEF